MTIRVRLTTWYAVVGAVTLLVLGFIVWFQYAASLGHGLAEVLIAEATATREIVEAHPGTAPDVGLLERGLFLVVFDSSGKVTYSSPGAPTFARPVPGSSSIGAGTVNRDELYAVAAEGGVTVVAGSSLADIDRNLDSLLRTMAVVGAAGAIILILGGWWLAGRALAPVAELTRAADAIGSRDLDRRLAEPARQDELGALARTLNRMLARIEDSARRQRAFVIGASHDLRTPLTTLRTELELAMTRPMDRDGLLAAVEGAHADAVRLSDLATGLLRLADARGDGRPMDMEKVDLRSLVGDCTDLLARRAATRGVRIMAQVPDAEVSADRARLQQAIANLLDNALRYAPPSTAVDIHATVTGDRETRILQVEVLDLGPGVAADVQASLFEPFARSRTGDASGTGLGLASAAAAVHAHGGEIGYVAQASGGSRFWFWIPA